MCVTARLENNSSGGDVTNIMTSQQALMKRKNVTTSTMEEPDNSWQDSAADHIKGFECPAGDRYVRHQSTYE